MSLGGTSYAAVKAKSIGSKQLKSNSVTSAKIARNAVTASDIGAGVIDGSKIRAGAVDSARILDGTIGGQDIAPNSIGSQYILDGSIGAQDIAGNSIGPAQIADQSIGLGELDQATVNRFKDVPTTWIADGAPTGDPASYPTPTVSTDAFTTMRSYSVPAVGTGKTGTTLVQSQVNVVTAANQSSTVECYIYVAANSAGAGQEIPSGIKATSTSTVTGRVVVPVTALVSLVDGNVVQTRCRAVGAVDVKADVTNNTGATSMTLMRVAD